MSITMMSSSTQEGEVATKVLVRAISRDAKVIGTGVGGVRIIIRDLVTGTVLVQGLQEGGTGSTELIMLQPHKRVATIFDMPGTAGFLATASLERPTVVEVIAEGPLGAPQAMQRVSKTLLLIPGKRSWVRESCWRSIALSYSCSHQSPMSVLRQVRSWE